MRRIAIFAAPLALAACFSNPATVGELKSHPFVKNSTVQVPRSPSAVMASLTSSRANACLNFTYNGMYSSGPFAFDAGEYPQSYRSRRSSTGLVLEHRVFNVNPAVDWYPRVVVDVAASGGGTALSVHVPFGDGYIADAIKSYAQGNMRPCPRDEVL